MSLRDRLRPADPAAAGATVGRIAARDPSSLAPLERAVRRFNRSQAALTVAGLTRTLGTPFVSVGAAAGSPTEVRITVAWELCWYQWSVDLGEERPVFQIARGEELAQLDGSARQWNARAVDGGRLLLNVRARCES
ncbi:MAG TPA: hypothetical protein VFY04_04850 [Solirubrobacterales bacterium]|nr:hypothetical protein [Solirubrobacterales bacterium]